MTLRDELQDASKLTSTCCTVKSSTNLFESMKKAHPATSISDETFAALLDAADPLSSFRHQFNLPLQQHAPKSSKKGIFLSTPLPSI
jgi:hypothetical protein